MSISDVLREDAVNFEASAKRLTEEIEDAEERIVKLRRQRDEVRLKRVESLSAADYLDNSGFTVRLDKSGAVNVSIKEPT